MAKITFLNKVTSVVNPVSDVNKARAQDFNEIKESVNYIYDGFGWERYFDTLNTVVNKQTLIASQDNVININALETILTQAPLIEHDPLFSVNKIRPISNGDCYTIRIDFSAQITNQAGFFQLSIDAGGDINKIIINSFDFPGGANVTQIFSINAKIYSGSTFLENGANITIFPSHTMTIWDKSIMIERTYAGR
jgi:hypothetical protein